MVIQDNNSWAQGHLEPWWGLKHRELPYTNEPFNDMVSLNEWRNLGYTQTKFTGDMYDMRQEETPWLSKFKDHFPFQALSWSVYKMTPGCVLPEHGDTYDRFIKVHELPGRDAVVRIIVFLEDWASGHYLEMNKTPILNWKAGDWVCWRSDFLHLAANIGKTDRYTLQLTGIL
jgi:hypothetical protein